MNVRNSVGLVLVALLVSSCGGAADDTAEEQPADTAAMAPAGPGVDANGTWDLRAQPVSGSDTTTTVYQAQVVNGSWTVLLPNRDPIAATAVVDGDSIIVDLPPFESVRRAGTTVTTHSVFRIVGDQLTGITVARYQTSGADSVIQLGVTGTRVR